MVNSDRATRKLLAIASALGVVAGVSLTAGTAMASPASGPSEQAVVAISGSTPVTVPGVRVQTLLASVHIEIVDGDPAAIAALKYAPGVLGVESNAAVHLDGAGWGSHDGNSDNGHGNNGHGNSNTGNNGDSDNNGHGNGHENGSGSAGDGDGSQSDQPPADGSVVAPTTLGGVAGTPGAGSGVTVALIDTGVTDTAALNRASGRLVDAVDTSGLNSPNGDVREHGTFTDGYGHGTFMASVIAGGKVPGSGDTALGVAPGATIDVVKVADAEGNTSLAAVVAALNWVATHSDTVKIANLSLGIDTSADGYGIDPLNLAVTLTRDAGVAVVVAAGNVPGQVSDPGFDPEALTVGAADTTSVKPSVASFSGYGNVDGVDKPDVVAAGVKVLGEMPAETVISKEYPAGRQPSGLFRGSGTSQSTAIVSGLATLYLQSNGSASAEEVKAAIRDSASSIAADGADGEGIVTIPQGDSYPASDTGEASLGLDQWCGAVQQAGAASGLWPEAPDQTWDNATCGSAVWNPRLWAGRLWAGRLWAGRLWAGRLWAGRLWAGRLWAGRLWAGRLWAGRLWAGQVWSTAVWGGTA